MTKTEHTVGLNIPVKVLLGIAGEGMLHEAAELHVRSKTVVLWQQSAWVINIYS